jgi:hypothetical protein
MDKSTYYMTAGRDYRLAGRYEYVISKGEKVVLRAGCFKTNAAAKRAGLKAAAALMQADNA